MSPGNVAPDGATVPMFFPRLPTKNPHTVMIRASMKKTLGSVHRAQIQLLHQSCRLNAASVFRMPAMSPTMTEGGVVSWKYKPGEAFSAGDVLLEVETDKATIDVEAVDDGVMWEILVNEGASGVPVGKPIAFLAEEGDDLKSLEKPSLEEQKEQPKEQPKEQAKEPKESKQPKEVKSQEKSEKLAKSASSSTSIFQPADPNQKLFPSVELLLHQQHISFEDAIKNIPASGPKGRLLKGDVLSYLGKVDSLAISSLTEFLHSKQHLDLSNITLATPEETDKLTQKEKPKEEAKVEVPKESNLVTFTFAGEEGETIQDVESYVRYAISEVYAEKFPQFELSPNANTAFTQSTDDIFDELLIAPPTQKRFEVVSIKPVTNAPAPASADAFDELLGLSTPAPTPIVRDDKVQVEVTLKLAKVADAKEFARRFEASLSEF